MSEGKQLRVPPAVKQWHCRPPVRLSGALFNVFPLSFTCSIRVTFASVTEKPEQTSRSSCRTAGALYGSHGTAAVESALTTTTNTFRRSTFRATSGSSFAETSRLVQLLTPLSNRSRRVGREPRSDRPSPRRRVKPCALPMMARPQLERASVVLTPPKPQLAPSAIPPSGPVATACSPNGQPPLTPPVAPPSPSAISQRPPTAPAPPTPLAVMVTVPARHIAVVLLRALRA